MCDTVASCAAPTIPYVFVQFGWELRVRQLSGFGVCDPCNGCLPNRETAPGMIELIACIELMITDDVSFTSNTEICSWHSISGHTHETFYHTVHLGYNHFLFVKQTASASSSSSAASASVPTDSAAQEQKQTVFMILRFHIVNLLHSSEFSVTLIVNRLRAGASFTLPRQYATASFFSCCLLHAH
jgi:hypothetical protein